MFSGKGTITYPDGSSYNGNFVKDKRTGDGTFNFYNGDSYKGYFKDNKFEGQGTFTYENGDVYKGEFKEGLKHGEGVFIYVNKDKFEGHWKNGKRDTTKHELNSRGIKDGYDRGWGIFTINRDNTHNYDKKQKDESYYQKWKDGKLIGETQR